MDNPISAHHLGDQSIYLSEGLRPVWMLLKDASKHLPQGLFSQGVLVHFCLPSIRLNGVSDGVTSISRWSEEVSSSSPPLVG
ncbi:hypothetical protein G7048_03880 [Diaphorobacter sp. HDW4B]|uniref:hypothetical protein n=1 Tax=Diaphorobacter sp. HDW4B TaxID=2714925 RepID=UPI00140B2EF0|nr:hypothetical protein [Diaphorobacter sp. HDW4B]QIL69587.1 hypothetical protein G7048_03880 [Diaphorobacter sp. HDW4B]